MARKKAAKRVGRRKTLGRRGASGPRQVETVRHKDRRKNIPTEELRGSASPPAPPMPRRQAVRPAHHEAAAATRPPSSPSRVVRGYGKVFL